VDKTGCYGINSGRRLIRPIAPDCGLSQAADELLEIKRTAGELPPAETAATPHLRTWARRRN